MGSSPSLSSRLLVVIWTSPKGIDFADLLQAPLVRSYFLDGVAKGSEINPVLSELIVRGQVRRLDRFEYGYLAPLFSGGNHILGAATKDAVAS